MKIQITGRRKMLVTLGAGAIALVAIACSSETPEVVSQAGNPPPSPPVDDQGGNGQPALGAPANVIQGLPPSTDQDGAPIAAATDGTSSGFPPVADAVQADLIASGPPVQSLLDCETGTSHPATLTIDGGPITLEPVPGSVVHGIPELTDSPPNFVPAPGTPDETTPDIIVIQPVGPPSILPTPELPMGADDPLVQPVFVPEIECDSGATDPGVFTDQITDSDRVLLHEIAAGSDRELPADLTIVEAPIESAAVTVAESFPPQYILSVVSGLPSGAATHGEHRVKVDGNVVAVSVTNFVRTGIAATQIYGTHQANIGLGTDFRSGEVYSVVINGERVTEFTAQ